MSEGKAMVPTPKVIEMGVLSGRDAASLVDAASSVATTLARVIDQQKLYSNIQGKRYVRVEGWLSLLAMLGVLPREVNVVENDAGAFTATVELVRMSDGAVVGQASAECGPDEPAWRKRPRYARRSMASTRATGKAARLGFSWIMALAGYATTPAEEMDFIENGHATFDAEYSTGTADLADEPFLDDDNDTAGDDWWKRVCVPFGKNKGKRLVDLSMKSIQWYYNRAAEQINAGNANDADKKLHAACIAIFEAEGQSVPS